MDRSREMRRGSMAATSNGVLRRRQHQQRSSSSNLRDSPEDDGVMEMQETTRLRDRGGSKKERERLSRSKRRRGDRDRLMHASNRGGDDGGEDSSEDSLDDDEDDEDEEIRMPPPHPSSSSTFSNHHHHDLHHRKTFPPMNKVVRAAQYEMGFSVPRKARSASAKRSHEWNSGGGGGNGGSGSGGGEQIHRQASTSPARPVSIPAAPASPSSSSASLKKKLKPIGPKQRPPKVSKPAAAQDEIEIEVAEVLYGLMRQTSRPESSSQRLDSKEMNGSTTDCRSRVSSPISVSQSSYPSQKPSQNSGVVAPKRKKPRAVKYEDESSTNFPVRNGSIARFESEQVAKADEGSGASPKLEKNTDSLMEDNGGSLQVSSLVSEPAKPEIINNPIGNSKPLGEKLEDRGGNGDGIQSKEVILPLPQKESPSSGKIDFEAEDTTATKAISKAPLIENQHREQNLEIDLMAPPLKSSPERDGVIGFGSESKSMKSDVDMKDKVENVVKEEEKLDKMVEEAGEAGLVEKKKEVVVEECESQKSIGGKQLGFDLQIDLEKQSKDSDPSTTGNKTQEVQKQHHQSIALKNEPKLEKEAQSTPMSLPMTPARWPGSHPSLGCGVAQVRPVQGVASMDGNPGPSNATQPPHFLLSQRPKRCTTHYYIARNIHCHQQFARMNPYWPAAAGSASMYGAKPPYNLNVLPPTETAIIGNQIQGSHPVRNLNSAQDKGQLEVVKDKTSVASSFMDPLQKKQIVLQQAPQTMPAPAYIFLSQQQAAQQQAVAAAMASNKSGNLISQTMGNPSSSSSAQSVPGNSSSPAAAAAAAATLNFNYQNLAGNEGQYLAILQNNGYSFPVPAQVGAPPHYRGGTTPAQAMPFFNGPFYSSQMLHPAQIQQQQILQSQSQQQQQQQPNNQVHQNTSTSSGSSSSQKHQQSQQQRLQVGGSNVGGGNSNSFPTSKSKPQHQQNHTVPVTHQMHQPEADAVVENSPSTEDSRVSQGHKALYSHNYGMAMHPKNFASMSPVAVAGGSSGNHSDKQQQQQQNSKGGGELVPPQAFAMPFASFNGGSAVPGFDMAQNHMIFQSLPEAARHGYQQMAAAVAAAQAAQQKRNLQFSEDMKIRDTNIADDERKTMAGKGPSSVGQALVFSRPDSADASAILGSSVVDSSARTLNLISGPNNVNRTSRSSSSTSEAMAGASAAVNTSNSQQQQQHHQMMQFQKHQQHQQKIQQYHQQQLRFEQPVHQQQQQQQMQQQQMQHQLAAAAVARSKPTNTANTNVYSDRLSSSSMTGKFPTAVSVFPQALVQSGSPAQSPQWKSSSRPAVSSPVTSSNSSHKNHLAQQQQQQQQQGRTQQGHTQISFGVNNPKGGAASHGQQIATSNQSSSPPVVGSPPRSMSKSAGGSPRTTSTGSKVGPAPSIASQQQAKNSSSGPSRKSSPVGGRNVPSILGNSHVTAAPSSNTKPQSQHQLQQQQQQQQQKQALQQTQLFFSNPYAQAQSPQSTGTPGSTSQSAMGYYNQRRQSEQQQQQQSSSNASSGMLSLCPLTLAGVTTSDPTKAAAVAAANSMKGGVMPPGLLQASQFTTQSGGHPFMTFPYMQSMSTVQIKPAEQKQPGNDNLHACWQPEKR